MATAGDYLRVGAAIACTLAAFVAYELVQLRNGARQLLACGETLHLGDSEATVTERLSAPACGQLQNSTYSVFEHESRRSHVRVVRTPLVFGASNWHLRLEMDDGVLSAIRYRTTDSSRHHPSSAPADVASSSR